MFRSRQGKKDEFLALIQNKTADICERYVMNPNTGNLRSAMKSELNGLMKELIMLDYIGVGYSFDVHSPSNDETMINIIVLDVNGIEIEFEDLLKKEGYM